ncbi:hypothetical protein OKW29_000727 [Paraburkholderia sp. CI3]
MNRLGNGTDDQRKQTVHFTFDLAAAERIAIGAERLVLMFANNGLHRPPRDWVLHVIAPEGHSSQAMQSEALVHPPDRPQYRASLRSQTPSRVSRRELFQKYKLALAQRVEIAGIEIFWTGVCLEKHERCDLMWAKHRRLPGSDVPCIMVLPRRIDAHQNVSTRILSHTSMPESGFPGAGRSLSMPPRFV